MNYVYGTTGHDIMYATNGSDWIYGLAGRDSIHGLGGKDIFVLASVDDKEFIIDFQDGSDLIDLRQIGIRSFADLELLYEYDTDIVETSLSPMRLYMNLMNDPDGRVNIDSTDFIYAGTPVQNYTAGNDMVQLRSNVYSVHLGDGGIDTLDLLSLTVAGAARGAELLMEQDRLGNGRLEVDGVTQHFFDFENVYGTNAADRIFGDSSANYIAGRAGDDLIVAGGGNDKLLGGGGNDSLKAAWGNDVMVGGAGRDFMWGGYGADTFAFQTRDDRIDGVCDYQDGQDRLNVSDWGVTRLDQLTMIELSNGDLRVTYQGDGFVLRAWGGADLSVSDMNASDFIFA